MTRKQAIDIYHKKNKLVDIQIERIMQWDESKSLSYNYKKLGIGPGRAWHIANKYGLKYANRLKRDYRVDKSKPCLL